MSKKITAGVILIENTKKPGVIQTEKSQVKRKEWEKQNQCGLSLGQNHEFIHMK